ncbi:MAG: hypothetical protein QME81_04290, partial [bacterium]|nr:hypothetical protein [bacterium]
RNLQSKIGLVAARGRAKIKSGKMKPIRLSGHARSQLPFRGTTEDEIKAAIRSERWAPAESGRLECCKNFSYGKEWNGKIYATKQVRPIFVEEAVEIVVVTVYTYYF